MTATRVNKQNLRKSCRSTMSNRTGIAGFLNALAARHKPYGATETARRRLDRTSLPGFRDLAVFLRLAGVSQFYVRLKFAR